MCEARMQKCVRAWEQWRITLCVVGPVFNAGGEKLLVGRLSSLATSADQRWSMNIVIFSGFFCFLFLRKDLYLMY